MRISAQQINWGSGIDVSRGKIDGIQGRATCMRKKNKTEVVLTAELKVLSRMVV